MEDELIKFPVRPYFWRFTFREMRNISIVQLSDAVRNLERMTSQYSNRISQMSSFETQLATLQSEIARLRTEVGDDDVVESSVVNPSVTDPSVITAPTSDPSATPIARSVTKRVRRSSVEELKTRINALSQLHQDVMDALKYTPTYDDTPTSDDHDPEQPSNQSIFNTVDETDSRYAEDGTISGVLQIMLGNTKLTVDKDDSTREMCSISNDSGGMVLRRTDSKDVWIIDREADREMSFRFNDMDTIPLTLTPTGIKTNCVTMNGKTVTDVAKTITEESVNDKTIPTVGAIVKYINSNLQKLNLLKAIGGTANGLSVGDVDSQTVKINEKTNVVGVDGNVTVTDTPIRNADISATVTTVDTIHGPTLLVENATNSIALRDVMQNIMTIRTSSSDGLIVGDRFKMRSLKGKVFKMMGTHSFDDVKGKFIETTGNVEVIDGIIIPEVKLTSHLSSVVCGVVNGLIVDEFVIDNVIHHIPVESEGMYITAIRDGFMNIPSASVIVSTKSDQDVGVGSILLAGKNGSPTLKPEGVKFAVRRMLPAMKVIGVRDDELIVEVL